MHLFALSSRSDRCASNQHFLLNFGQLVAMAAEELEKITLVTQLSDRGKFFFGNNKCLCHIVTPAAVL